MENYLEIADVYRRGDSGYEELLLVNKGEWGTKLMKKGYCYFHLRKNRNFSIQKRNPLNTGIFPPRSATYFILQPGSNPRSTDWQAETLPTGSSTVTEWITSLSELLAEFVSKIQHRW